MNNQPAEFEGLCPVALAEGTDFPGSEQFESNVNGKRYLFGSPDGKELFDKDPQAILDQINR